MAKEGILFVLIPLLIVALLFVLFGWRLPAIIPAAILLILAGYFAFFFRDPVRRIVAQENEIVSPVDGTVLDVLDEGQTRRIIFFLSIFNVHVTRLPFAGRLEKTDYFKGTFLPAYREKASELNERITLTVHSDKLRYTLRLIAGVAARRIRLWVKQGDDLQTGQKIGIILFGSRAELIFPKSVEILIKKNDTITGGLTLIGKI